MKNTTPDGTVLDILLKRCAREDELLLCSLARVCKEWNVAVQQADSAALSITYRSSTVITGIASKAHRLDERLVSLALWLAKHGRLVSGLHIHIADINDHLFAEQFRAVAGPLLHLSLRAATQQGLRLSSFSTNVLNDSSFLRALPCANLTNLEIGYCDGEALAPTLPLGQKLRVLRLAGDSEDDSWNIQACLPALARLSNLTSLRLDGAAQFDTRQLPPQLLQLELQPILLYPANLTHLSGLTSLKLDTCYKKTYATLPTGLMELSLLNACPHEGDGISATEAFGLTSLRQLRRLAIHAPYETREELLQLAGMPQLQHLSLAWDKACSDVASSMVRTCPAWPHIGQLQQLGVYLGELPITQLQDAMCNISWSKHLTQLELQVDIDKYPHAQLNLCRGISTLHKLQELKLVLTRGAKYWTGQAHYLRPLTCLTCLEYVDVYTSDDDA